jgi:hypothetical protein
MPGTRLHQRLESEGRLLGESSGDNVDGTTNFRPRMDREALHAGYRQVLEYLYAPRPYYRRIRTFLREFRPRREIRPFQWRNLHAFVAACLRLGVFGRERVQFWGLLAWTTLRRPWLLSTAITLSIYGHHFRRCSAAICSDEPRRAVG